MWSGNSKAIVHTALHPIITKVGLKWLRTQHASSTTVKSWAACICTTQTHRRMHAHKLEHTQTTQNQTLYKWPDTQQSIREMLSIYKFLLCDLSSWPSLDVSILCIYSSVCVSVCWSTNQNHILRLITNIVGKHTHYLQGKVLVWIYATCHENKHRSSCSKSTTESITERVKVEAVEEIRQLQDASLGISFTN